MFFEDEVFDITTDGACPVDRPIESAEEQEVGANLRMDMHPFKEVADWNDATLNAFGPALEHFVRDVAADIIIYLYLFIYIQNIHIYIIGGPSGSRPPTSSAEKQQSSSRKAAEKQRKGGRKAPH